MSRSLDTGKFGKMVKSKVQGSEERLKTQTKTFRKWCNVHLPADELIPPGELIESLQDGTRLCMLVESLTGRKVKYRERARIKVKIHKMENISLALSKLTKAGVRLDDVEANMIFEGKVNMILGLFWRSIIFAMANDMGGSGGATGSVSAQKGLLQWVKRTCKPQGVKVKNFSSSFKDGRPFAALIASYRPDLLTMDGLRPGEDRANIETIFAIASAAFSIPQLIDADDLCCPAPDAKCVATQVAEWFKVLSALSQAAASTQAIVDAATCARRHRVDAAAYVRDATLLAVWVAAQSERIGGECVALSGDVAAPEGSRAADSAASSAADSAVDSATENTATEDALWTSTVVRAALDALYAWRAGEKADHAATLQRLESTLLVLHASQMHNDRAAFVPPRAGQEPAALCEAWDALERAEQRYAKALLARLALCRHADRTQAFVHSIATRAREAIARDGEALASAAVRPLRDESAIEDARAEHRALRAGIERTEGEVAGLAEYTATLHAHTRPGAEAARAALFADAVALASAARARAAALDAALGEERARAAAQAAYCVNARALLREAEAAAADLIAPLPVDTLPLLDAAVTRARASPLAALAARLAPLRAAHAELQQPMASGAQRCAAAPHLTPPALEGAVDDLRVGAAARVAELEQRRDAQRAEVTRVGEDYMDRAQTLAIWIHDTSERLSTSTNGIAAALASSDAATVLSGDAAAVASRELESIEAEWRSHRAALDALPFALACVGEVRATHGLSSFTPEIEPADLDSAWATMEAKLSSSRAALRDAEVEAGRSTRRVARLCSALDEHDAWAVVHAGTFARDADAVDADTDAGGNAAPMLSAAECESCLRALATLEVEVRRRQQQLPRDGQVLPERVAAADARYGEMLLAAAARRAALRTQLERERARSAASRCVAEESEALVDDLDALLEALAEPMWAGATVASVTARRDETAAVVADKLPRCAAAIASLRAQCAAEARGDAAAVATVEGTEVKLRAAERAGAALLARLDAHLEHERAAAERALVDGVSAHRVAAEAMQRWLDDGTMRFELPAQVSLFY